MCGAEVGTGRLGIEERLCQVLPGLKAPGLHRPGNTGWMMECVR